jgi:hypothetical protein
VILRNRSRPALPHRRRQPTARPGVDRPELLPGWIATPPRDNDPFASAGPEYTVADWLRERADEMANRVHELGKTHR